MAKCFDVGDETRWQWSDRWRQDNVNERFSDKATRTINGIEIARNASDDHPADPIAQSDGETVRKAPLEEIKAGKPARPRR